MDRPNLGINFDPANMILYGSGDPLEALETVKERVITVHCKDGSRPVTPGEWAGKRRSAGAMSAWNRFVAKLKEIGYRGI